MYLLFSTVFALTYFDPGPSSGSYSARDYTWYMNIGYQ